MKIFYDVIVIGAGPAGSAAARRAALDGASVLLVEKAKFPRSKVCGCCVNRTALACLTELGLDEHCKAWRANAVDHVRLWSRGRWARLALPRGVAVSRAEFDMRLAQAAVDAGVEFRDEITAKVDGAGVVHFGGKTVKAKMTVIADGLSGRALEKPAHADHAENQLRLGDFSRRVRRSSEGTDAWRIRPDSRMGFGASVPARASDIEPGVIEMACGTNGYVGQVRLEDGRVDVAGAMDPASVREHGGPSEAAAATLREAGVASPDGLERVHWTGTPQLTRKRKQVAMPGILFVGDAAGYVEPFTGEGIAWALRGGIEAGAIAAQAGKSGPNPNTDRLDETERAWIKRHRQLVRHRQRRCRLTAATLRRPRLSHAVVCGLSLVSPGRTQR